jgi:hypothetical protein
MATQYYITIATPSKAVGNDTSSSFGVKEMNPYQIDLRETRQESRSSAEPQGITMSHLPNVYEMPKIKAVKHGMNTKSGSSFNKP